MDSWYCEGDRMYTGLRHSQACMEEHMSKDEFYGPVADDRQQFEAERAGWETEQAEERGILQCQTCGRIETYDKQETRRNTAALDRGWSLTWTYLNGWQMCCGSCQGRQGGQGDE